MRELYWVVSYPLKYLHKSSPIPQDPFFRHCLQQAQHTVHTTTNSLLVKSWLYVLYYNSSLTPQESSITGNRYLSSFRYECRLKHQKHFQSVNIFTIYCFS